LNDIVGSSEHTESRRRATNKQETINNANGSGRGLIFGIT